MLVDDSQDACTCAEYWSVHDHVNFSNGTFPGCRRCWCTADLQQRVACQEK
jgi:hypothetical protein